MHSNRTLALLTLGLLTNAARAHHGEDFLVTLDSTVPEPLHATAFSGIEWSRRGTEDEVSLEPGFMAGLIPGLALGGSFQFGDEDAASWDYAGIDPTIQWQIPADDLPVQFAINAGYVFAEKSSHSHSHGGGGHAHGDDGGGTIDPGPDGPGPGEDDHEHHHHDHDAGSDSHSLGGIHRHGQDHFHLRLIADTKLGDKTRLVVNLIGVAPGSGEYDFGYAIGLRHQFTHAWAAGIENIGDFNTHGENEVIAGLYWTPIHSCTVRLGAGVGIDQASSDFSLRSGITWRF